MNKAEREYLYRHDQQGAHRDPKAEQAVAAWEKVKEAICEARETPETLRKCAVVLADEGDVGGASILIAIADALKAEGA